MLSIIAGLCHRVQFESQRMRNATVECPCRRQKLARRKHRGYRRKKVRCPKSGCATEGWLYRLHDTVCCNKKRHLHSMVKIFRHKGYYGHAIARLTLPLPPLLGPSRLASHQGKIPSGDPLFLPDLDRSNVSRALINWNEVDWGPCSTEHEHLVKNDENPLRIH